MRVFKKTKNKQTLVLAFRYQLKEEGIFLKAIFLNHYNKLFLKITFTTDSNLKHGAYYV